MEQTARQRADAALVAGLLALAGVLLAIPTLLRPDLRHWDEAWYAQMARETLASGDWLTIRWNRAPFFHKPPLGLWPTMVLFHTVGESPLTARLFSAVCGLGTVVLLGSFVTWKAGKRAGLLAGTLLLGTPEFFGYVNQGQLDGPLTLVITAQLICFWEGLSQPKWHWARGPLFGVGLLIKGSAAALALVVEIATLLVLRDTRPLRRPSFWLAVPIGLLIALPWHLQQLLAHGPRFVEEYGGQHLWQFFANIYPERASQPPEFDYYLMFLLEKRIPWGWGIVFAVVIGGVLLLRRPHRLLAFAWAWTFAIPVSLSLATTKWNWYLVPMYPGAAMLIALSLVHAPFWKRYSVAFLTIGVGLLVFSQGQFWTRPLARDGEPETRRLASLIQEHIHPQAPITVYQGEDGRRAVYPVATLYYGRRLTQTVHRMEQLESTSRHSAGPFHLLLDESYLESFIVAGSQPVDGMGFDVVPVAKEGRIYFCRVQPRAEVAKSAPPSSRR
ncbi:Undecaprenyl phosphate-alpha-4-amino-4-deoxy-L-arabinose arabinosyl transferase [Planctomycetes bacterium Pan216]|uniref:Undecaprenyl phosphate-alpha-4-amino-4-deoxy-L-arabinose arabinosyl transferase n=1 Tax=Kolteria novifilia TaxID=2527975 RepID=A0A518B1Q4_9BACT|nr:Undecaprenyl phosphate-alpha-4-amino-4-deoxy-L-arabinose arabinosyl transferase [Planctomycetes bacterium Pan216]